ncbi:putative 25S rRNA (adenine(2142)-N(1))-methyltransferase [Apostichopus japonicus]|uniref:S-adenosylmethionine sensor upstream of mTORC1 n=1 Tax=Stichopus japonicus TaxID=307972 RepID=A0A2G8LN15_STIJA|nr:putative 25S rRNA (adenine(2142)-N(1))-methyltransferase [Apostichopus japonicus]
MTPSSKKTRKRKRRKPVTEQEQGNRSKRSKSLIWEIHHLNQELDRITADPDLTTQEKETKKENLQEKIATLGGLTAYQTASKKGEHHHGNFNTAQWVIKALQEVFPAGQERPQLELLDVGAVSLNYEKQKKWISCTAIDLHPQQADILECDLIKFQMKQSEIFDVIVLSLVLNFAGTPEKRGRMLQCSSRLCKENGYVFIVLPLACLDNSRYMTDDLLDEIMASLGFKKVKGHNSRKLSFKMYQKEKAKGKQDFKKRKVREGVRCNNFCITMERRGR